MTTTAVHSNGSIPDDHPVTDNALVNKSSSLHRLGDAVGGRLRLPSLLFPMRDSVPMTKLLEISAPHQRYVGVDNGLQELLGNVKEFLEEARRGYWPMPMDRLLLSAHLIQSIKVLLLKMRGFVRAKHKASQLDRQRQASEELEDT